MGAVDQIKNRSFSTEKRVVRFELPACPPDWLRLRAPAPSMSPLSVTPIMIVKSVRHFRGVGVGPEIYILYVKETEKQMRWNVVSGTTVIFGWIRGLKTSSPGCHPRPSPSLLPPRDLLSRGFHSPGPPHRPTWHLPFRCCRLRSRLFSN